MKDAPAFDFYPERWLVGTAMFSDAEQLSYLKLLCHQWLMQGLPDDLAALKRIAGKGVTPALLAKFPVCEDGLRRNARLESIREAQRERIAMRRKGAAKTNAKRWGQQSLSDRSATPERHADSIAGVSPPPTTHHPPIVLLEKEPKGAEVPKPVQSAADEQARRFAAEASAVEIPLSLTGLPGFRDFVVAWTDWCEYRTERALVLPKSSRVPWTTRASRNSLLEVERYAAGWGLEPITTRIRAAISGGWQGLNLDRMGNRPGGQAGQTTATGRPQPPRQHTSI